MKRASRLALGTWALLALVASTAPAQPPGGPGGRPGDGPGRGQAGRFNPIVRLFDANSDGTLTQDEIEGAAAKLKEFDASKDGKLTADELRRAKIAEENFKKAGVDDLITVVLGDAHETVKRYTGPIDILFLDADKEGYLDYLDKLLPLVRPGGLVIAHNMRYPNPNPDYIKAITTNPKLETTFLLMEGAGVGVTLKKR